MHSDSLFTPKYWLNRQHGRFGSVFLNPNMLGAFTVLVFPATFIVAMNESNLWRRLYAWSGLLALVFCLVETQSRGPLLALGISLMLLTIGPCGGVSRSRRLGFLAMQFNFVVSTNAAALRVWERHGFAVVGRPPRAFRHATLGLVDALVLHREL